MHPPPDAPPERVIAAWRASRDLTLLVYRATRSWPRRAPDHAGRVRRAALEVTGALHEAVWRPAGPGRSRLVGASLAGIHRVRRRLNELGPSGPAAHGGSAITAQAEQVERLVRAAWTGGPSEVELVVESSVGPAPRSEPGPRRVRAAAR